MKIIGKIVSIQNPTLSCDGDGFSAGKEVTIKTGSTWVDEGKKVVSAGDIHLENTEGKYGWLEVYKEDLTECFEPIK